MQNIKSILEIGAGKRFGTAVSISNELHIIGGCGTATHIKYNPNTQNCDILHDLKEVLNLNFQLNFAAAIQNKDKLMALDIRNDHWATLSCKLPEALSYSGCTQILNGQFVLILGGSASNSIYIYCVQDRTFKESQVIILTYIKQLQ